MAYGWNEQSEYEKLCKRYPVPPSLVYGVRDYYPADYLRLLELKKQFAVPAANPAELLKNELTDKAQEEEKKKRYLEAEKLWLEIAAICRQGDSLRERDAYLVEHRAKQCLHMEVYKNARISIRSFDDVPNLDKLQDALTCAAKKAMAKQDYATFTVCSLLNARLCHAQGKERDAFLLEESTKKHGFFESYFVRPGEDSKNPPVEEMILRQIAQDYASELYPK
jgi:hypothetical protein